MGTVPSGVSDRPSTTLTFLLTDVVGSTPLCEHDAAEMGKLLAQHDATLTSMIESNGGVCEVFETAARPTTLRQLGHRLSRPGVTGGTLRHDPIRSDHRQA